MKATTTESVTLRDANGTPLRVDQLAVPLLKALGVDPSKADVTRAVLTLEAGQPPTLVLERMVRDATNHLVAEAVDPPRLRRVLERYRLRLIDAAPAASCTCTPYDRGTGGLCPHCTARSTPA